LPEGAGTAAAEELPLRPSRVGLPRRLAAAAYDALIVFALIFVATFVLMQILGEPLDSTGKTILRITAVAIAYAYFVGFWTRGGQTIGMRAWRIRLTDPQGRPVALSAATLRFLTAILSWLAAGLGFWWVLVDGQRRAWHDRCSSTRLRLSDGG
jgi:uncharacterized RDD family membrane protein YckC